MKTFFITFAFSVYLGIIIVNAQTHIASGKVTDKTNGEYLPATTIFNDNTLTGTTTNPYGYYSLKLAAGQQVIEYSYVGYKKVIIELFIRKDTVIDIQLEPITELDEVTINANRVANRLKSSKVSVHSLNAKELDALPSLLGETDIIKELRSLPGVNSGSEGAAGLIVRGSGPDQNLVLLDGVPIYNINHLSGFFSVFNTDALASAEMYKGAYPARYGGRISSVTDIRMREGNLNKFEGKISVGTIASKLTFEGPIIKNKASFILSARRTYLDLLSTPTQKAIDPNSITRYSFDDYTLKMNYIVNNNNRFYLSGYKGKDIYTLNDKSSNSGNKEWMDWGNSLVSARWNCIAGNNTFVNITGYAYNYKYTSGKRYHGTGNSGVEFENKEQIENVIDIYDYSVKADVDYSLSNRHHLRYGAQYIYHQFYPNKYNYYKTYLLYDNTPDTIDIKRSMGKFNSGETHIYLEDEIEISTLLKTNLGLHYSSFIYKNKNQQYLMPTISVVYLPTQNFSVKMATGQYSQYAFLMTNPGMGMPSDTWLQSLDGLKPMTGWQTVLGLMYNAPSDWFFTLESYYKITENVLEYKEMHNFNFYNRWDDLMAQGRMRGYGVEAMVEKRSERIYVKASYACTRSKMYFDGLNNGKPFWYTYDAPHNVNFEALYKINKKVDFGMSWTYASGKLLTLAEQHYTNLIFYENGNNYGSYPYYGGFPKDSQYYLASQRNNHRVPPYHRLDVGVNFTKSKKRGTRVWSTGIYNVYNRKNVFYVYNDGPTYKATSLTSIIPYLAYSFKF